MGMDGVREAEIIEVGKWLYFKALLLRIQLQLL